ncbi:MAG: helix-turn-helix domain-containing protein [Actinomycetota bacterium]|nr:helix-turn-helix domain-containing protein [Actinomycetota bacterium]
MSDERNHPKDGEGRRNPGVHLPMLRPGEDLLSVPSAFAFHEARRAVTRPERFGPNKYSPWPMAQIGSRERPGFAVLRPPQTENPGGLDPDQVEHWVEEMWRQRAELSDLDADVLDGMMAAWISRSIADPERLAHVGVDELLELRGVKKNPGGGGRRGGYREKQRATIVRAVGHLQNIWVDMGVMEVPVRTGRGRGTKMVEKRVSSHLVSVEDVTRSVQPRLDAPDEIDGFVFRPGRAISIFLDDVGRQVTLLAAQALRYHPDRQTWEKRLARTLSWRWRVRARKPDGYSQPYKVGQLLRFADETLNERRPLRTRERLEKALDTLERDGVIAAWQYERFCDPLEAPRQGWVGEWLASTVVIEPPDAMKDLSEQIEARAPGGTVGVTPKTRRGREVGEASIGGRLKEWRKENGYSQARLAEMLGIPQAAISSYERGKVIPAVARAERIEALIGTGDAPSGK